MSFPRYPYLFSFLSFYYIFFIIGERSEPSVGSWMEKLRIAAHAVLVPYVHNPESGECTKDFTDSTL